MRDLGKGMVWWTGVVRDTADPLKIGRLRVNVYNYYDGVEDSDLPWAIVMNPINSAGLDEVGLSPTGIQVGSTVVGFFIDGEEGQRPLVMGSIVGIPGEEPDTSRLARNDSDYPPALPDTKDSGRTTGVSTALGGSWSEPASAYDAKYPDNQVKQTSSGHVKEYDDTAGKERIHEYHKAGTFYEIDASGNRVTRVVGNNYEVVAGNDYLKVKGNCNITVDSTCRIKAPNIKIETDNMDIKAGRYTLQVTGETHIRNEGAIYEYIGDDTHLVKASGKTDFGCPTEREGAIDCTQAESAS